MYKEIPVSGGFHQMKDATSALIAPASPIESALSALGEEISALEKYVSQLRARASKVATPPPPSMPCGKAECASTGPHSQTWHSITDAKARIASIGDDIRELTSRLET